MPDVSFQPGSDDSLSYQLWINKSIKKKPFDKPITQKIVQNINPTDYIDTDKDKHLSNIGMFQNKKRLF